MAKYKPGDTAYLIENGLRILKVEIKSASGGMYLIRFENGGGIRVKEHRLYKTLEEAEATLPKKEIKAEPAKTIYDYGL